MNQKEIESWFRKCSMRTQLLLSFGVLTILVYGIFIAVWAVSVFSLKATLIDSSKAYLTEQISLIGIRITSEVNDLFDAKLSMGASSFLYPVAFGLYDAYDASASLMPLPTHAGGATKGCANPLMCLRPPTTFDDRNSDDPRGSFRCALPTDPSAHESFKALCGDWDGVDTTVQTAGGCSCKGQKTISPTASAVFVTEMDGSESVSSAKVGLFSR